MANNNIVLPILFSTIAFCIAVFCVWIAYTNPRLIVRRWPAGRDIESAKTETVAASDEAANEEVTEDVTGEAPAG